MMTYLMTDPDPESYFISTNFRAEAGDLVFCIITEEDKDIEEYKMGSKTSKETLTLLGLCMLQEPIYTVGLSPKDRKQLVIDVLNETKQEIIGVS